MFTQTFMVAFVIIINLGIYNCQGVPVGGNCDDSQDCADFLQRTY